MKNLMIYFLGFIWVTFPYFIGGLIMGFNILESLVCSSILVSITYLVMFFLEKIKKQIKLETN